MVSFVRKVSLDHALSCACKLYAGAFFSSPLSTNYYLHIIGKFDY